MDEYRLLASKRSWRRQTYTPHHDWLQLNLMPRKSNDLNVYQNKKMAITFPGFTPLELHNLTIKLRNLMFYLCDLDQDKWGKWKSILRLHQKHKQGYWFYDWIHQAFQSSIPSNTYGRQVSSATYIFWLLLNKTITIKKLFWWSSQPPKMSLGIG